MLKRTFIPVHLLFFMILVWTIVSAASFVKRGGGKSYIVDMRGEPWDITQAESIGFKPEGFQFGIGKDAFTPLDDSSMSDNLSSVPRNLRIIGVEDGSEAHAYSVRRLRGHETANSTIGSKPIVVGY